MSRLTPADLERIAAQPGYTVGHAAVHPVTPTPSGIVMKARANTDESDLNKTEAAYLAHLRASGWTWVGVHTFTIKLGKDLRYTPDFWTFREGGGLIAHEVKGFWRDDAKVKIKAAARLLPFIDFIAATRKGREWNIQSFKP